MIAIKNGEFVDEHDRVLNLRGVNLAGSTKIPAAASSSSSSSATTTSTTSTTSTTTAADDWLKNARDVSFVNRPFPLEDADEHFTRLRACGLKFVRFLVTWEAIEHGGPGVYDREYLSYVRKVLEKADAHGISVYLDPHQDVWSRWTGGDGAPLWTLEHVGFDVRNFEVTKAALCQQTYGYGGDEGMFPKMIWPTNYFKLACSTMFTLFWAGERFAPHLVLDGGMNVQTYLQTHYIDAMAELLKALDGLDNIVGIGTMNEPSPGYIGVEDLSRGYAPRELKDGLAPTPFQGMCLGEGLIQTVGTWSNGAMQHVLGRPDRTVRVDPHGARAWREEREDGEKKNGSSSSGGSCIWREAGVWRIDPETRLPELSRPGYFADVDFGRECYLPFAVEYAKAMRAILPDALIFVELPPLEFGLAPFPEISPTTDHLPGAVNATHWYDGMTLFTGMWKPHFSFDTRVHRPVFGTSNVRKMHLSQLADIKKLGDENMHGAPTLIGECGIPYNMNDGAAFRDDDGAGDFTPQVAAMDHTIACLEGNMLSYTLWCYTPDNDNVRGDLWNNEDLSIYSPDQRGNHPDSIYDGCRAARAYVRPYAECIAGKPIRNSFDLSKGEFTLVYLADEESEMPSEVFLPKLCFATESDIMARVSDGRFDIVEFDHWFILKYWHSDSVSQHCVEIQGPMAKLAKTRLVNWGQLRTWIGGRTCCYRK